MSPSEGKKNAPLPPQLASLVLKPTHPHGQPALPRPGPSQDALKKLYCQVELEALRHGVSWAEWLSLATAAVVTLNSPESLRALYVHVVNSTMPVHERVARALLMREVGLKCIGFIGIPKVINNLAALRKVVETDAQVIEHLPTTSRRRVTRDALDRVQKEGYALWGDIYTPVSDKLIQTLARSHPDLPVYIIENVYGPLFAAPADMDELSQQGASRAWEVNRLRTSLVAIAALRAQGGAGPQVISHIRGLRKARPSVSSSAPCYAGLVWLTSDDGAEWAVQMVDQICRAVEAPPAVVGGNGNDAHARAKL